jgi:alpha-glucosidase (family GH31 glycosyl hydrolase)
MAAPRAGLACTGLVVFLVALVLFGSEVCNAAAEPSERVGKTLTVSREDARSFKLSQPGSPTVRVTFLAAETFRIHVLPDKEDSLKLPEYMVVKSAASYQPVDVRSEVHNSEATFRTTAVAVRLVAEADVITVDVRTPTRVVIASWKIYGRTARIELNADEHIYGLGDKRVALDQRGLKVQMLNHDAYGSETTNSYKSIPFYMSTAGYGLFFHNFYQSTFDLGDFTKRPIEIKTPGGDLDFYVFVGDLKQILSRYTELTGRPALLPRWAFGYQQGKASYEGRAAFDVAAEMRRRKLPLDAIYYDDWIEEATRKKFIRALWRQYHVRLTLGFGMPLLGDYGETDDSALLGELAARGYVMVDQNNQPVIGPDQTVDAGDKSSSVGYVDFFSPKAVDYLFAKKWQPALANGVILGMVDFGEMDNIPYLAERFWPSNGMSVAQTRNLFGLVYPLAVVGGAMQRTGGRSTGMVRPGFAGTQRMGWTTTGDSLATYRNWRAHMRAMLNLTLSGFSNVGQDIGGWDYKGPDVLYARWFAAGTFFPFMWSHGQGDHEPYSHGATVENVARKFLNLRYRLVPYLYSLHELAHRTGLSVLRAFALQESDDPLAPRIEDQFFVGNNLMVAPIFDDEGTRKVYLPKGLWYDFFGELAAIEGGKDVERKSVPLDRIPVYVRAGAVIPLGPEMQYTAEKPVDPLSVYVYSFAKDELGQERSSKFVLYEDDGISTAYQRGAFERTSLRFRQTRDTVRFEVRAESGDGKYRPVAARSYGLHFRGLHGRVQQVFLDGKEVPQVKEGKNFSGAFARWENDGIADDIFVSIPHSASRSFDVRFSIGAQSPKAQ